MKRPAEHALPRSSSRPVPGIKLSTTNLTDGETVHQRCLLLTGSCTELPDGEDTISITTTGPNGSEAFPEQTWPVAGGSFKALVMLSPGQNTLSITHVHDGNVESEMDLTVNYVPLLQYPPLHLVIMAASDSPLMIDCPPHKRGGVSSAHSDLDAAIAKFRMTAYMWQAMTAEDLRQKGIGRRAFRLDEEWTTDTVSREFVNAVHDGSLSHAGAIRATAKVHVIRSSRTTREIRDANFAQQNPNATSKNQLFDYFMDALKEAGGPFTSSANPIVAGLILDSHYSVSQDLILGHAALGCHNPKGISLGMMGSHLTYSWPRFVEEVTSCLLDTKAPGDKVGNDNGECTTMWEACTIGQGAFLHEAGHAFGSPHRPGIMERGYAQDWPKHFLPKTAYCGHTKTEGVLVTEDTPNNARWDLADALAFRSLPHFWLPSDPPLKAKDRAAHPEAWSEYEDDNDGKAVLHISCPAGIVRVAFNDQVRQEASVAKPVFEMRFSEEELESQFKRTDPLSLSLLAANGKQNRVGDVWKLLANKSFISIPGTKIRLYKRSVCSFGCDEQQDHRMDDESDIEWAQLLRERGRDGKLYDAKSIDLCVGCIWDGGVVTYSDGHTSHWGPMKRWGQTHRFGGHATEEIELGGSEIESIEVNRGDEKWGSDEMYGIRMHLANGTSKGELNGEEGGNIVRLEPGPNEVIVGFYGKNTRGSFCGVIEFGIITAPKEIGIKGLPEAIFDMPELKNTAEIR